jgi:5-methylcytosine-specific restriction endonuclease McrA
VKKLCDVDGCEKPARSGSAAYCKMHYHRMYRYGTLERTTKANRYIGRDGYVYIGAQREHRIVYRNHHGDRVPPCWGCGKPLSWDMGKGMHIDHINEDRTDNRISNLRASCYQCNVQRSARHNVYRLTVGGVTKPLPEWMSDPRVSVRAETVRNRIRRGWTDEDALFRPRISGPAIGRNADAA